MIELPERFEIDRALIIEAQTLPSGCDIHDINGSRLSYEWRVDLFNRLKLADPRRSEVLEGIKAAEKRLRQEVAAARAGHRKADIERLRLDDPSSQGIQV